MNLFVWDFHGVLEKDNEKAVIEISNYVLTQAGFSERISESDNERLYGLKWFEYFEILLPRLSRKECLDLQTACIKYAEANFDILIKYIKPNDHAYDVLSKIAASDNQQIVISNSRQADLIWFLKCVNLKKYFSPDRIVGVDAHQKHTTKTEALKEYLYNNDFPKIIVIGDSENDLNLGRAVGATTYYYRHPHRKHEKTQNADYIINDLRVILKEL